MQKSPKERILLVHFLFNLGFTLVGWLLVILTFIRKPGFLSDNLRTIFTVAISAVALVYLLCELISYLLRLKALRTRNIHTQKSQDEVNGYLYDCLNNHDRTVVFTRGFNWAASSDRMRELLTRKAKDGELTVCIAEELPFTNELRELGAEVYAYHMSEALLSSRFIILGYGTTHPVVNAGSKSGKGFINEVYDYKHAPNACKGFVELFERTKAQCMAHSAAASSATHGMSATGVAAYGTMATGAAVTASVAENTGGSMAAVTGAIARGAAAIGSAMTGTNSAHGAAASTDAGTVTHSAETNGTESHSTELDPDGREVAAVAASISQNADTEASAE